MDGIIYMNVTALENPALFEKGMSLLSKERQEKIHSFKNPTAARLSLGAGILLYIALKRCDCMHQMERIQYGAYGKPYLEGTGFYFNLSHSGEYAVCAFSDYPIGVDLQQNKDTLPRHLKRILSDEEQQYLQELQTSQQAEFFYKIWSRKESLVKWSGKGLRIPLQEYSLIQNHTMINQLTFEGTSLSFIDFEHLMPQYHLCICTEKETFPDFLEEIDANFLAND